MNKDALARIFNEEVGTWQVQLIKALRESLQKKKINASEDLLNSLAVIVTQASESAEGKVALRFKDYGRHRDMRKLIYTSQPPVDVIAEWVKEIGVDKFRYVPGYRNSNRIPSRDMAANRIAWGIAGKMQRKRIVTRAKRQVWYNSPLWSKINELENKLTKRYADTIVQEMIKSTK